MSHHRGRGYDAELVGILYVHNLVANVVGCFDEIYQRVAGIAYGAVGCRAAEHTELGGHTDKGVTFGVEETEFVLPSGASDDS